jgi:hypothetical protein
MTAARRLVCLVLALAGGCLCVAGTRASDRGIGGTGAPAEGPEISDRGIGGTGIVGVITGFGSVIVNGLEVAYTASTPLTVDGVSGMDATLSVGQLATIVASDGHGLHAVSIDVRHEVSGPVTSVSPNGVSPGGVIPGGVTPGAGTGGRMLVVAGQRVAMDSATDGLRTVRPGDWVAVSGLRGPDGVIAASRIDQRVPGTVLVRGVAVSTTGGWQIGDLSILPPNGVSIAPGATITARGTLVDGRLSVTAADPDVLSSDPAAFFGSHVRRMVIESYVSGADGRVRLGRGLFATAAQGIVVPAGEHRAIVQFERGAHGDFVATHLRRPGRPVEPRRAPFGPDRRGSLEPPHAASRPFGPERYQPRPWHDRREGFGERRRGGERRR